MSEISKNADSSEQRTIEPRQRLTVVLGLALLIALVAWVLTGGSGTDEVAAPVESTNQSASAAPTANWIAIPASIVTKDELIAATKDLGVAIYWNGETEDTNIELTVLSEGKVFVRYLPKNIEAGSSEAFFTVATYYDSAPLAKVQNLGATAGAKLINYQGGAVAASASESDSNIYFAFDGNPALYNIYSPDPNLAWSSLESGSISILR